jgi:hypothetical protein
MIAQRTCGNSVLRKYWSETSDPREARAAAGVQRMGTRIVNGSAKLAAMSVPTARFPSCPRVASTTAVATAPPIAAPVAGATATARNATDDYDGPDAADSAVDTPSAG